MNKLNTSTTPSKCCIKGCKNSATRYFDGKQRFFVCDECFERVVEQAIALRTPKSPTNTIKRILDKKREDNYD